MSYNSLSREITARVLIYFKEEPLVVTPKNYLMSLNITEELGSEASNNPIGDVSANELTLHLFNTDGIFNPANNKSPYYGLMKSGVKVVVEIKPVEQLSWDPLGVFYVNDWQATVTSFKATLTCYDDMYKVINTPKPHVPVSSFVTFREAFNNFLNLFAVDYEIVTNNELQLSYWFSEDSSVKTLNNLSAASLSASFCNKRGVVKVIDTTLQKTIDTTLTDANQIKSATITQSLLRDFDGISLTINNLQISGSVSLVDLQGYKISQGSVYTEPIQFSNRPVAWLDAVSLETKNALCTIDSYTLTADDLSVVLDNESEYVDYSNIKAYGRYVESTKSIYSQYGNDPIQVDNMYIQNTLIAERINAMLDKYLRSPMPTLELSIRGNPTLELGSKIRVISARYNLDFTGILQRATYEYNGALSSTIVLVDSDILEVT